PGEGRRRVPVLRWSGPRHRSRDGPARRAACLDHRGGLTDGRHSMDDRSDSASADRSGGTTAPGTPLRLLGFHHLTAVSAAIRDNKRFYTETLGMRLVKRSVNQDDVSAYHLFYSDTVGTPGNDITFFDWPAPREQRGNNSVTRTGLRVADEDDL